LVRHGGVFNLKKVVRRTVPLASVPPQASENPKDLWMRFISAENEEALEMLVKESPIMDKAVKKLVYVSADELVRYEMDMREKMELDYRSARGDWYDEGRAEGIEQGIVRGRAEGMEKGIEQGKLLAARGLLQAGLGDTAAISKALGMSEEEIKALIK